MSETRKDSAVIRIGRGVYEIEPEKQRDLAPETAVKKFVRPVPEQNTGASGDKGSISFADAAVQPSAEQKGTQAFHPVTNPLKIALDNGQIELSELTPEERASAKQPKKTPRGAGVLAGFFSDFKKGDSPFLLVSSLVNAGIYIAWLVAYIICVVCREIMMDQAVMQMQFSGTTDYTVTISSPVFAALKIILYAMPVIMILWTVVIIAVQKKQKQLCDNVIIIGAYAADFIAGFTALADVFLVHIMFD